MVPLRRTVRPLTAPLQMLNQTALNVAFDLTVSAYWVSEGKVIRPTFQVPVQLANQDRDRLETLMTVRHLMQLLPLPLDRLLGRKDIQVFPTASFQIRGRTEMCTPESSDSLPFPVDPPLASFPD